LVRVPIIKFVDAPRNQLTHARAGVDRLLSKLGSASYSLFDTTAAAAGSLVRNAGSRDKSMRRMFSRLRPYRGPLLAQLLSAHG
jgi:hypothetical protein